MLLIYIGGGLGSVFRHGLKRVLEMEGLWRDRRRGKGRRRSYLFPHTSTQE